MKEITKTVFFLLLFLFFSLNSLISKENNKNLLFNNSDCQPVSFELKDVINSDLNLIENASVYNSNSIQLTNSSSSNKGAAWYKHLVPLSHGFETTFSFKISEAYQANPSEHSEPGADGLAFIIQNNNYSIIGKGAGWIGYTDIPNSIAIEIDLFKNDDFNDPDGNHIAVQTNKQGKNSVLHNSQYTLAITSDIPIVKSNGSEVYYVKIVYNAKEEKLIIYMNNSIILGEPVLEINNFCIDDYLDLSCSCAYVGFTSATGESYQNHDLLSWSFKSSDFTGLNPKIIGDLKLCKESTGFLTTSKDFYSYLWSTGETTKQIEISQPGKYSVIVTDENGCVGYDTVNVEVYEYIAYYSFDDGTARDYSGNGFNGTIVHNPTPVEGINGNTALYFQPRSEIGNEGDHILLPRIPFEDYDQFTVSMWVKEDTMTNLGGEGYIWFGDHWTGWFGITNMYKTRLVPPNYVQFAVGAAYGIEPEINSIYQNDYRHKWMNYVMTYKDKMIKAYINGEFVDSMQQEIKIEGNFAAIASHHFDYFVSTRFKGAIDEVKIYCRALTNKEILEDYKKIDPVVYDDCAPVEFELEDVINTDINYIEQAKVINDYIRLSRAAGWKSGAIWYRHLVPVSNGFETTFSFKITDGFRANPNEYSEAGGDGIVFVIQNESDSIIGGEECLLGYTGIPYSLAIEIDMYRNKDLNDPDGNHIAVQTNRKKPNTTKHGLKTTLGIASDIPIIKSDGSQIYYCKIKYDSELEELIIYLDTANVLNSPVLTINDFQLDEYVNTDCSCSYIGFTSTTGESYQNHDLLSWHFKSSDFVGLNPKITGDLFICTGTDGILATSKEYDSYLWSTGETSKEIEVSLPGEYSVIVSDEFACIGYDTVNVISSDYIAYYSFEDETAKDLSGNGFDGTLINNPIPVEGVNGGTALYFHTRTKIGNEGDHILLPRLPLEDFEQFSVSMWVKEDSLSDEAGEGYIWLGNYNTGWFGIGNFLETNLDPVNNIQYSVGADSEINPVYSMFLDSYKNKWVHYAMTFKDKKLKAFINGELIDSTEQEINIDGDFVAIASHKFGDLVSTRFQGAIDEVKVFCRYLTDEEIKTIFENEGPIITKDCEPTDFELVNTIEEDINLLKSSTPKQDFIRLTSSSQWSVGAAWYKHLVPLSHGFETTFSFKISEPYQANPNEHSEPGADGLAFVIQNNNDTIIGKWAGWIGYTDIPNSIAIEIDLFKNDDFNDPDGNHIAVQTNKQGKNSALHNSQYTLGITSNIPIVKSNGTEVYYVKVVYNAKEEKLIIYMNNSINLGEPVLEINNFCIDDYLDLSCSCAYVGFTSATGESYQNQDILSWHFKSSDVVGTKANIIGDLNLCGGKEGVLSTSKQYSSYFWSTGETTREIEISRPGNYAIEVEDYEGCKGYGNVEVGYEEYIAYYSFEDGTANDSSDNHFNGTIVHNPYSVEGINGGKAMYFQPRTEIGNEGDHILLPRIPFEDYKEFSVSMWVKEEDIFNQFEEAYIWFGDHWTGWLGIGNMNKIRLQPPNYIQFAVGAAYDIYPAINSLYSDSYRNRWMNYTMTYKDRVLKGYINGVLIDSLEQDIRIEGDFAAIASHYFDGFVSTRFQGAIDEVKIHCRALSGEEILDMITDVPETETLINNFEANLPYPNPANTIITIPFSISNGKSLSSDLNVSIYDNLGRKYNSTFNINTQLNNDVEFGEIQIQTQHLESGIYYITVSNKEFTYTYPVTIVK